MGNKEENRAGMCLPYYSENNDFMQSLSFGYL